MLKDLRLCRASWLTSNSHQFNKFLVLLILCFLFFGFKISNKSWASGS